MERELAVVLLAVLSAAVGQTPVPVRPTGRRGCCSPLRYRCWTDSLRRVCLPRALPLQRLSWRAFTTCERPFIALQ